MANFSFYLVCLIISIISIQTAIAAPSRPKNNKNLQQTLYDQKQTGDYNVQLHLKDFQIIALLADGGLGDLGDYDYNYDYADFTVKPNNTSSKPTELPQTSSPMTTPKPNSSPSTTAAPSPSNEPSKNITSEATPEKVVNIVPPKANDEEQHLPDKIKVQIIETPIIPNGPSHDHQLALEELVNLRRCATGYTRDHKGKCKRVRKPARHSPFDITKFATSLASRIREASEGLDLSESS